ncbi:MAG: HpcH/HpaI aldolase/citrate lyase family protein [Microbacteriaceae bacterium]|nr:HpcH/HpaI aldolase/citrate lyase family protein [Microbacteriaceae bacterium]
MSLRVTPDPTFAARLDEAQRPLIGVWATTGNALVTEVLAGGGLDWVLIDAEHAPNDLQTILAQLHALSGYPITPLVRLPVGEVAIIKQYLDLGVQNLLVPMVETPEQAADLVRAVRYPPGGVRGVGSSLARSSRWNRFDDYLENASGTVSLFVQIESVTGAANSEAIAAVDGVDGLYVGPADLAASMGVLGQQGHPDVVAETERVLGIARAAGRHAGVNAFVPETADRYLAAGAEFVSVSADVTLLARGVEALAARFIGDGPSEERAGY